MADVKFSQLSLRTHTTLLATDRLILVDPVGAAAYAIRWDELQQLIALNPLAADLNAAGYNLTNVRYETTALTFNHVDWDSAHGYVLNEVVNNFGGDGLWYISVAPNTNHQPPNTAYWAQLPATANLWSYIGSSMEGLNTDLGTSVAQVLNTFNIVGDPNNLPNIAVGSAIVNSLSPPPYYANVYANAAFGGATMEDCNGCFAVVGDLRASNQGCYFGDGGMEYTTGCVGMCNAGVAITHANYCIAIMGSVNGADEAHRVSNSAAIGASVAVTASNAIGIGNTINTSTANCVEVGISDSSKVRIDTNGLTCFGGFYQPIASSSATSYTMDGTKTTVLLSNTAARTVTLSASPSTFKGMRFCVKDTSNTTSGITVTPSSGTIDLAASITFTTALGSRDIISDGTNWWLI